MKFKMHRNFTLRSTCGLSMEFKKGELVFVPPPLYAEAIAAGAIPETELTEDELPPKPAEPPPGAERDAKIAAAFEAVLKRGLKEEFTAGNVPHASVLTKELGWAMNAKERDEAWRKFTANQE
jgi:hypothetical protein